MDWRISDIEFYQSNTILYTAVRDQVTHLMHAYSNWLSSWESSYDFYAHMKIDETE